MTLIKKRIDMSIYVQALLKCLPPFNISSYLYSYPKWKHFIPEQPSVEQFNDAWRMKFKADPLECITDIGGDNGINSHFVVVTPRGIYYDGGFIEHTDCPVLGEDYCYFYEGGCTWGIDLLGQRFYRIDADSGLPKRFDDIMSMEIIKTYLKQNAGKEIFKQSE